MAKLAVVIGIEARYVVGAQKTGEAFAVEQAVDPLVDVRGLGAAHLLRAVCVFFDIHGPGSRSGRGEAGNMASILSQIRWASLFLVMSGRGMASPSRL